MADLTKFQSAMVDMSPLLLSMARGFNSPVGPLGYVDQGLAMMMEQRKAQQEKAQAAAAQSAFMSAMGGGMGPGMGGAGVSGAFTGSNMPPAPLRAQTGMIGPSAQKGFGLPSPDTGGARGGLAFAPQTGMTGFTSLEAQYGLPEGYLARTAQIESGGNPNAQNPTSSAGGLFQFIDSTAKAYGLENKMDPQASADAAARLARDNAAALRGVLGRDPTAAELYLAHQQGGGGAAALLANPNARAVDIVGADAVRLNGGDENMTAGQFASKWLGKFGGQAAPAEPQVFDPFQDPTVARIAEVLASPNITAQQAAVLEARMNARIAAISPQAPVEGKAVGDSLVNPYSGEVIYQGQTAQATPMNAAQRAMWGIPATDTRAYAVGKNGMPEAIGGAAGTTVNVGSGEGEFEKELAKGQATMFNTMAADSVNAQADLGQIDVIEGLMASGAGGAADAWKLWAQNNLGVQIAGGAVEALDAAINKLVPTQRAPGSGTMSDRDVQLFKDSLPKLINTPEGNSVIVGTMRGMAEYKRKQGEIASAVINGTMDRRTAIAELQKLPDPLGAVKAYIKTTTPAVKPIVLDGYQIEEVQ